MLLRTLAFLLPVMANIEPEDHGVFFKIDENSFPSDGKTIWHGRLDSLLSCSQMCARRADLQNSKFYSKPRNLLSFPRRTRKTTAKAYRTGRPLSFGKGSLFFLNCQASIIHYYSCRLQLCASKTYLCGFNVLPQKERLYFTKIQQLSEAQN